MNWSPGLGGEVPRAEVAVTATAFGPSGAAGAVAVIEVVEWTTTVVAGTPPKVSVVVAVNRVPVMVTAVPATVGPPSGLNDVTVGDR